MFGPVVSIVVSLPIEKVLKREVEYTELALIEKAVVSYLKDKTTLEDLGNYIELYLDSKKEFKSREF